MAAVYRIPLGDLLRAPEVGDRRLRRKPRRVDGGTVLPMTQPGNVQAWKIIVTRTTPEPRRHDGFEWRCALSGRLRVVLGDEDLLLGVGEAVEVAPQVPHWSAARVEPLGQQGRRAEARRRADEDQPRQVPARDREAVDQAGATHEPSSDGRCWAARLDPCQGRETG